MGTCRWVALLTKSIVVWFRHVSFLRRETLRCGCEAPPPPKKNSVVVLTGAGAASYLGYPALHAVKDTIALRVNDPASHTILDTWNALEAGRAGGVSFEEVIAALIDYLSAAQLLKEDGPFRRRLGSVPPVVSTGKFEREWRDALTVSYQTLVEKYGPRHLHPITPAFSATITMLKELAARNESKTLDVFTTNYDCAYQVLASQTEELCFVTHINNAKPGDFKDNWYYVRPGQSDSDAPLIYVHRLHGCVAWIGYGVGPYKVREVYGAASNLQIHDQDALHDMCIKLVSNKQLGTNPAFSLAFEEFALHLRTCECLFVWGHSFQDLEVLRILNQAMSSPPRSFPIVFLDPYMDEWKAREHIVSTLANAPVIIASEIELQNVPWHCEDGHQALVTETLRSIDENLKRHVADSRRRRTRRDGQSKRKKPQHKTEKGSCRTRAAGRR